jgi:hypothetical protein
MSAAFDPIYQIVSLILSPWVDGFSRDNFSASIVSGYVKFKQLKIRTDLFADSLELPVKILLGFVENITIHIPWTIKIAGALLYGTEAFDIAMEPISVVIETVKIVVGPNPSAEVNGLKGDDRGGSEARTDGSKLAESAREQHSKKIEETFVDGIRNVFKRYGLRNSSDQATDLPGIINKAIVETLFRQEGGLNDRAKLLLERVLSIQAGNIHVAYRDSSDLDATSSGCEIGVALEKFEYSPCRLACCQSSKADMAVPPMQAFMSPTADSGIGRMLDLKSPVKHRQPSVVLRQHPKQRMLHHKLTWQGFRVYFIPRFTSARTQSNRRLMPSPKAQSHRNVHSLPLRYFEFEDITGVGEHTMKPTPSKPNVLSQDDLALMGRRGHLTDSTTASPQQPEAKLADNIGKFLWLDIDHFRSRWWSGDIRGVFEVARHMDRAVEAHDAPYLNVSGNISPIAIDIDMLHAQELLAAVDRLKTKSRRVNSIDAPVDRGVALVDEFIAGQLHEHLVARRFRPYRAGAPADEDTSEGAAVSVADEDPYELLPADVRAAVRIRAVAWWKFAIATVLADIRSNTQRQRSEQFRKLAEKAKGQLDSRNKYIDLFKKVYIQKFGFLIVPPCRLPGFTIIHLTAATTPADAEQPDESASSQPQSQWVADYGDVTVPLVVVDPTWATRSLLQPGSWSTVAAAVPTVAVNAGSTPLNSPAVPVDEPALRRQEYAFTVEEVLSFRFAALTELIADYLTAVQVLRFQNALRHASNKPLFCSQLMDQLLRDGHLSSLGFQRNSLQEYIGPGIAAPTDKTLDRFWTTDDVTALQTKGHDDLQAAQHIMRCYGAAQTIYDALTKPLIRLDTVAQEETTGENDGKRRLARFRRLKLFTDKDQQLPSHVPRRSVSMTAGASFCDEVGLPTLTAFQQFAPAITVPSSDDSARQSLLIAPRLAPESLAVVPLRFTRSAGFATPAGSPTVEARHASTTMHRDRHDPPYFRVIQSWTVAALGCCVWVGVGGYPWEHHDAFLACMGNQSPQQLQIRSSFTHQSDEKTEDSLSWLTATEKEAFRANVRYDKADIFDVGRPLAYCRRSIKVWLEEVSLKIKSVAGDVFKFAMYRTSLSMRLVSPAAMEFVASIGALLINLRQLKSDAQYADTLVFRTASKSLVHAADWHSLYAAKDLDRQWALQASQLLPGQIASELTPAGWEQLLSVTDEIPPASALLSDAFCYRQILALSKESREELPVFLWSNAREATRLLTQLPNDGSWDRILKVMTDLLHLLDLTALHQAERESRHKGLDVQQVSELLRFELPDITRRRDAEGWHTLLRLSRMLRHRLEQYLSVTTIWQYVAANWCPLHRQIRSECNFIDAGCSFTDTLQAAVAQVSTGLQQQPSWTESLTVKPESSRGSACIAKGRKCLTSNLAQCELDYGSPSSQWLKPQEVQSSSGAGHGISVQHIERAWIRLLTQATGHDGDTGETDRPVGSSATDIPIGQRAAAQFQDTDAPRTQFMRDRVTSSLTAQARRANRMHGHDSIATYTGASTFIAPRYLAPSFASVLMCCSKVSGAVGLTGTENPMSGGSAFIPAMEDVSPKRSGNVFEVPFNPQPDFQHSQKLWYPVHIAYDSARQRLRVKEERDGLADMQLSNYSLWLDPYACEVVRSEHVDCTGIHLDASPSSMADAVSPPSEPTLGARWIRNCGLVLTSKSSPALSWIFLLFKSQDERDFWYRMLPSARRAASSVLVMQSNEADADTDLTMVGEVVSASVAPITVRLHTDALASLQSFLSLKHSPSRQQHAHTAHYNHAVQTAAACLSARSKEVTDAAVAVHRHQSAAQSSASVQDTGGTQVLQASKSRPNTSAVAVSTLPLLFLNVEPVAIEVQAPALVDYPDMKWSIDIQEIEVLPIVAQPLWLLQSADTGATSSSEAEDQSSAMPVAALVSQSCGCYLARAHNFAISVRTGASDEQRLLTAPVVQLIHSKVSYNTTALVSQLVCIPKLVGALPANIVAALIKLRDAVSGKPRSTAAEVTGSEMKLSKLSAADNAAKITLALFTVAELDIRLEHGDVAIALTWQDLAVAQVRHKSRAATRRPSLSSLPSASSAVRTVQLAQLSEASVRILPPGTSSPAAEIALRAVPEQEQRSLYPSSTLAVRAQRHQQTNPDSRRNPPVETSAAVACIVVSCDMDRLLSCVHSLRDLRLVLQPPKLVGVKGSDSGGGPHDERPPSIQHHNQHSAVIARPLLETPARLATDPDPKPRYDDGGRESCTQALSVRWKRADAVFADIASKAGRTGAPHPSPKTPTTAVDDDLVNAVAAAVSEALDLRVHRISLDVTSSSGLETSQRNTPVTASNKLNVQAALNSVSMRRTRASVVHSAADNTGSTPVAQSVIDANEGPTHCTTTILLVEKTTVASQAQTSSTALSTAIELRVSNLSGLLSTVVLLPSDPLQSGVILVGAELPARTLVRGSCDTLVCSASRDMNAVPIELRPARIEEHDKTTAPLEVEVLRFDSLAYDSDILAAAASQDGHSNDDDHADTNPNPLQEILRSWSGPVHQVPGATHRIPAIAIAFTPSTYEGADDALGSLAFGGMHISADPLCISSMVAVSDCVSAVSGQLKAGLQPQQQTHVLESITSPRLHHHNSQNARQGFALSQSGITSARRLGISAHQLLFTVYSVWNNYPVPPQHGQDTPHIRTPNGAPTFAHSEFLLSGAFFLHERHIEADEVILQQLNAAAAQASANYLAPSDAVVMSCFEKNTSLSAATPFTSLATQALSTVDYAGSGDVDMQSEDCRGDLRVLQRRIEALASLRRKELLAEGQQSLVLEHSSNTTSASVTSSANGSRAWRAAELARALHNAPLCDKDTPVREILTSTAPLIDPKVVSAIFSEVQQQFMSPTPSQSSTPSSQLGTHPSLGNHVLYLLRRAHPASILYSPWMQLLLLQTQSLIESAVSQSRTVKPDRRKTDSDAAATDTAPPELEGPRLARLQRANGDRTVLAQRDIDDGPRLAGSGSPIEALVPVLVITYTMSPQLKHITASQKQEKQAKLDSHKRYVEGALLAGSLHTHTHTYTYTYAHTVAKTMSARLLSLICCIAVHCTQPYSNSRSIQCYALVVS